MEEEGQIGASRSQRVFGAVFACTYCDFRWTEVQSYYMSPSQLGEWKSFYGIS